MCLMLISRVSRTQMAIVLWRRSNHVDKQEMDALLDIAVSSSNTEGSSSKSATKSSRKRPREEDSKPEEQSNLPVFYVCFRV